jgi:hypothetical protein
MMQYFDLVPATPVTALFMNKKCLLGYYQRFNPYDDYFVRLGRTLFVYLNSGQDALLELTSLLMADPATVGFSDAQATFLERVAAEMADEVDQIVLLSHSPILNPTLAESIRSKIAEVFRLAGRTTVQDFSERKLREFGEEPPRSDVDLQFRHGTIATNWVRVLEFCQTHGVLHLCGHTHKNHEIRSEAGEGTPQADGLGQLATAGAVIYMDRYTEEFPENYVPDHLPFFIQTPALGLSRDRVPGRMLPVRVLEVRNHRIQSVAIRYIDDLAN